MGSRQQIMAHHAIAVGQDERTTRTSGREQLPVISCQFRASYPAYAELDAVLECMSETYAEIIAQLIAEYQGVVN